MPKYTPPPALERAIELAGGAARLATNLDVSPQAVSFWRSGERRVPAEQCPAIERLTNHLVRCEDLRPDVPWDVLRLQAASPA
jgi:DNA-binding transcriptional regulator YdaS (Cro superfamily)